MYGHWNGDVWKAIVHSRTYDYADTYTCKIDHGIGIVFKRANKDRLDLTSETIKKLKFADYYNNHNKFMNLINYDEVERVLEN